MTNFLHIGIGKTGTTTIQAMLASNSDALLSKGYLYPKAARLGAAHYGLFDLQTLELTDFSFDDMKREIEEFAPRHVVLSSENLSFAPPSVIDRLKATFGAKDTKVIFYCREQIQLIESVFLQWVKDGWEYRESVDDFFRYHRESFDFLYLINPWAKAFGDEQIIANVYDKAVVGKNVARHFLKVLGVRGGIQAPLERFNPSLLPDFYPLVQRMDASGIDTQQRATLMSDLLELSTKLESACAPFVSEYLRAEIKGNYADSNREFAERFLPPDQRSYFLKD